MNNKKIIKKKKRIYSMTKNWKKVIDIKKDVRRKKKRDIKNKNWKKKIIEIDLKDNSEEEKHFKRNMK